MLFWNCTNDLEANKAVVEMAKREDPYCESRRETALKYGSLYEGLQMSSLAPFGYGCADAAHFWGTDTPIIRNAAHEVVDTFVSKIAALDTPKAAFLTTEGSWRDRRQAKDIERLVEAEYLSPKGDFATLNELWVQAFRVASAATGAVIVRFWNDNGKVGAKIHDSLNCSISRDGRWVILRTWYEIDDAIELFPDREEDLRKAVSTPPLEFRAPQVAGLNAPEMVCVFEAWRGASGDTAGCYVAAIDLGVDALVFEEYAHERPPVVKLVIVPHLYGPWGHSLVHHMYESCFRDNVALQSVDRSVSKTNKQTTYVNKQKLADPDALDKSDDNVIVETNGDPRDAAFVVSAPGFHPQHLELADRHYRDAHQVPGVSEMHSGGRREPGLDSGRAQALVAALINERFAAVQRRYVQAVAVDSAKVILQILCDIYQDDRKLTRHWPGQDTLREISGAVALHGIEKLKYAIQPAAVSGSKNSPADRQQASFELFKSGVLSQDGYAELQTRGYDLPEKLQERSIQSEWLDRQMEKWCFASDKDVAKPDFYVPPLRHIDIPGQLLKCIDGFLEAQLEQLEDERLEFFLMFMADLSALLAANQTQPNQNPLLAPAPQQQAAAIAA